MPPRGDYPSSKQDQYMLRFPDGMRPALKAEAERNNRSLNAEIIGRLEESMSPRSPQGMALAMSLALNLASGVDKVLGTTSTSQQSASAMLSKALSGQGNWEEIEQFAEALSARIKALHVHESPPPQEEAPTVTDLSDFERELVTAQHELMKKLMRKHGMNFVSSEDLIEKDE